MILNSKKISYIVLSILILLASLVELTSISIYFQSMYIYVIKPLIWISILILTLISFDNSFIKNLKYKKIVDFNIIISTIIYFLIYFSSGYVKGFAHNPYVNNINGLLLNFWSFATVIISKEYVRYFAINNCKKNKMLLKGILISILLMLPEINLANAINYFSSGLLVFKYFMQYLMPQLILSLFLSYGSYYSGFLMPLIYRLFPLILELALPMLPRLNWLYLSLISSIVPFFSFILINFQIQKETKTLSQKEIQKMRLTNWILPITFLIIIVVFGLGLLPYRPVVIASNSMYPKLKVGDIVFIKDIDILQIKQGDILQYQMDNYTVIHRVEEIKHDKNNKIYFIMKGDNNNNIDLYPIYDYQILGEVKFNIKYLGYPTIWFNRLINNNIESTVKVETGK